LLFETDILREYELCRSKLHFSDDDLARVARYSIRASGATDELKRTLEADVDAWLASPA
jgi:adenosine deaminase